MLEVVMPHENVTMYFMLNFEQFKMLTSLFVYSYINIYIFLSSFFHKIDNRAMSDFPLSS